MFDELCCGAVQSQGQWSLNKCVERCILWPGPVRLKRRVVA